MSSQSESEQSPVYSRTVTFEDVLKLSRVKCQMVHIAH